MKLKLLELLKIPLLITVVYFALISFVNLTHFGFFSVVEEKSVNIQKTSIPDRKTNPFDNRILANEKIFAIFKVEKNNLGVVLIRFTKLAAIVSDEIVFRIKEKGKEGWYYEHKYKTDQFQNNQYFPFGFPPIINSKNRTYFFEVESLSGRYNNGVGLSLKKPQFAFVYKYSKNDLKNYSILSTFIFKKSIYLANNLNYPQIIMTFIFSLLILLYLKKNKITQWFTSTGFYLNFLDTDTKKKLWIGLFMFLFALTYRFSSTLVNQDKFFYFGLGGQGDYDQFIRVATCALNFCSGILGQNFLFESSILGVFYKIFGFTGGLKAYLYLMLILSSIVATIPHFLLSRKSWISIGGIFGSLFLATSGFLTNVALNFPPDNGSLFTFSIFYIVYLLTLQKGNIRWLLFLGLWGAIDALNKALFILNDLVALGLFAPVFFYEKIKEEGKFLFRKVNLKILFFSLVPLIVFLLIYIGWEYFVYAKYSAYYFLRGLLQTGGGSYVYYTSAYDASFQTGNILFKLLYLVISAIVMTKRLIDYIDPQSILLPIIFIGIFLSFLKHKFSAKKSILVFLLTSVVVLLLILTKNNYFKIHQLFEGDYIYTWSIQNFVNIFLLLEIVIFFFLNFKYSALKFTLPIITYVIMLIVLTKNAQIPRLQVHVVAWVLILFAYIVDYLLLTIGKIKMVKSEIILSSLLLLFFIYLSLPKITIMINQLNSGFVSNQREVEYLRWVRDNIPSNTVLLAGGKSDLVTVAENIKEPIIFNSLYKAALLVEPNKIPGISPSDFNLISELKNRNNFRRKKYIILEDDIYIWWDRLSGVKDNVFDTIPDSLHANDYSIKVYKLNSTLKKAIYELKLKDTVAN